MMLDRVNSAMYVAKLGLKRLKFIIARLNLQKLLDDKGTFFPCSK